MSAVETAREAPEGAGTVPSLETRAVTVRFGGLTAVADVSMTVTPGTIVGLVGPNGAGKTTLFGVMSGLLKPSAGRVFLGGTDVTRLSPQRRARMGLARTFQKPEIFSGLSVREHVVLADRIHHERRRIWSDLVRPLPRSRAAERERVDALLEMVGLTAHARHPAAGLSLGLTRGLEVARALACRPSVVLLDEPSSGLDDRETAVLTERLAGVVRDTGVSLVVVEHDVAMVLGMSSHVYVLDFGVLIAHGTPAEIRSNQAVRAAYLGDEQATQVPEVPADDR